MLQFFRAASTVKRSEPAALAPLLVAGRSVPVELRRDPRARRVTLRADGSRDSRARPHQSNLSAWTWWSGMPAARASSSTTLSQDVGPHR